MSIEVEDRTAPKENPNAEIIESLLAKLRSGELETPSEGLSSTVERYKDDNTVLWLIAMNESATRIMTKASVKLALFDRVLTGSTSLSEAKDAMALLELMQT